MVQVAPRPPRAAVDERAARVELRRQIALLEHQLSDAVITAFPHDALHAGVATPGGPRVLGLKGGVAARGGPRVLDLGELERARDALAARLAAARAEQHTRGERQAAQRVALERMLLEPGRYKFARVAKRDLGENGCGVWQVRPRMGLIGMLMGWWQVKLSSGCPLAS
jgi:hypothetical protein